MIHLIHIYILIGIMLTPMVYGQAPDVPSSVDEKKSENQTWIIATSLPDGVKSPVMIRAGEEVFEVQLLKRSVGKAIKVPKDRLIQVVKPVTAADGGVSYEILASVEIPEGVKESLIVLAPVPNLKPPLKFKGRVIDLDKFRGGDAMFVNLTNMEIGVTIGSKQRIINVGQIELVDVGDFNGAKNVTLSYHYRAPSEKKWNLISASTASLQSSRREILIFSYDHELSQIDYHGISFHVKK